jgi:hypothetical protein
MQNFNNIFLKNVVIGLEGHKNEVGALDFINVKFSEISRERIYTIQNGKPVQTYPECLSTEGINISINSILELNAVILNTLSTYLFNLRLPLNNGAMSMNIESINNEYILRIDVTKHFFRDKTKGRNKIELSIIINDPDFGTYEVISFQFSKRDVRIINSILKSIVSSADRTKVVKVDGYKEINGNKSEVYVPVVKIDNSLMIDGVWMHGQELNNILYIVNRLISKMNIEENLSQLYTTYRQIKVSSDHGIIYLHITKNGTDIETIIPVSAMFLSVIDLFLSIETIRHEEMEFLPVVENVSDISAFSDIKGSKYHIAMKESFLGVSVHERTRDGKYIVSLLGYVNENAYSSVDENGFKLENTYVKNNEIVDVLSSFKIDLKDFFVKFVAALSIALTKEYLNNDKAFNLAKFYIIVNDQSGKVKYEFSILASESNKVPAILLINKSTMFGGVEKFVASYRQPLFEKYLFQLITILLASCEYIDSLNFLERIDKKDLIKYRYKSMKNVVKLSKTEMVEYGIKKIKGITYWGMFADSNNMNIELTKQDQYLLNKSAESRILTGEWIPFVGDSIAIGPDRYLTDTFGEINLEEVSGVSWAIKLFMGTINKNDDQ